MAQIINVPWWIILVKGCAFLEAARYAQKGQSVSRRACDILCATLIEYVIHQDLEELKARGH